MKRLRAEEAHRIANANSTIIQDYLDKIFEVIERSAKGGRFQAYFTAEITDATIIDPIIEELAGLGYITESCSTKDINLTIKW